MKVQVQVMEIQFGDVGGGAWLDVDAEEVARIHSPEIGLVDVERAFAAERIIRWNDAPERTQDDVLAAFDRAIAALEVD